MKKILALCLLAVFLWAYYNYCVDINGGTYIIAKIEIENGDLVEDEKLKRILDGDYNPEDLYVLLQRRERRLAKEEESRRNLSKKTYIVFDPKNMSFNVFERNTFFRWDVTYYFRDTLTFHLKDRPETLIRLNSDSFMLRCPLNVYNGISLNQDLTFVRVEDDDPRLQKVKDHQVREQEYDRKCAASMKGKLLPLTTEGFERTVLKNNDISVLSKPTSVLAEGALFGGGFEEFSKVLGEPLSTYNLFYQKECLASFYIYTKQLQKSEWMAVSSLRAKAHTVIYRDGNAVFFYNGADKTIDVMTYADIGSGRSCVGYSAFKISDNVWDDIRTVYSIIKTIDKDERKSVNAISQSAFYEKWLQSSQKEFLETFTSMLTADYFAKKVTRETLQATLYPAVLMGCEDEVVHKYPFYGALALDFAVIKGDQADIMRFYDGADRVVVYDQETPNSRTVLYQDLSDPTQFVPFYFFYDNGLTYCFSVSYFLGKYKTTGLKLASALSLLRFVRNLDLQALHSFSPSFIAKHFRAYRNSELVVLEDSKLKADILKTERAKVGRLSGTFCSHDVNSVYFSPKAMFRLEVWKQLIKLHNWGIVDHARSDTPWTRPLPEKYGDYFIVTNTDGLKGVTTFKSVVIPFKYRDVVFKEKPYRFEVVSLTGEKTMILLEELRRKFSEL